MLENDERYDTDLTEEAWALIAPILPAQRPRGRPRTNNLRAVVNAIFYLLRTGSDAVRTMRDISSEEEFPEDVELVVKHTNSNRLQALNREMLFQTDSLTTQC